MLTVIAKLAVLGYDSGKVRLILPLAIGVGHLANQMKSCR